MQTVADHLFAAVLVVGVPLYAARYSWPRMKRRGLDQAESAARIRIYWGIMGPEWLLALMALATWAYGGRPWSDFGFALQPGWRLGSGLAASFAHLVAYAGSEVPTVGASGAIAGVLGAYLVLFPRARVVTLIPVFYFVRLVQIPAIVYLIFWFVSQLFNGLLTLAAAAGSGSFQGGGVAWWAHIGGFAFGLAILGAVRLIARRRPPPPPPPPYYYVDSRRDW